MYQRHEAVVVGGGGAGLMAALQLARQVDTAVISKLHPVRSHTGAAQGGIGAALGNLGEDRWEWHMFDTVKGSDYLADQDAVEIMCREAVDTVYELEHMGLPFSRLPDGRIAQRYFGGHTRNFGEAPVQRSCYAADRTGQMILHTLYQQCIRQGVRFYNEFHVLEVLVHDGRCAGVIATDLRTGRLHTFHTKAVVLATGGFGRAYKITSNALHSTGDAVAIAWRAGIPLEDMEFFQFHPTGIYKLGILITEGARGEGGVLRNGLGERFMERYAPTLKDLAPRDIISRAIYQEIKEGRGVGGRDYVYLDLTHLPRDLIYERLPDITDFVQTYLGIDPAQEPIPVQPAAHYAMGGIPTDVDGRVVTDERNTPLPGLYAAGECACVSVHGANRLGTNSLVDIIVFGRRAGRHAARFVSTTDWPTLPPQPQTGAEQTIERLLSGEGSESVARLRDRLQAEMMDKASVVRDRQKLEELLSVLDDLEERARRVRLQDRGRQFNTELLEALELGYLLDVSRAIAASALARTESRGAHYRQDYPERDDVNWLRHTMVYRTAEGVQFRFKPVVITRFQPMPRKY